mmetsp:Transcript_76/g.165  ORF Transcript_76/g.165 Transcript_76/m.165 type:complete len:219 (-) Transcript_76:256-912(-)
MAAARRRAKWGCDFGVQRCQYSQFAIGDRRVRRTRACGSPRHASCSRIRKLVYGSCRSRTWCLVRLEGWKPRCRPSVLDERVGECRSWVDDRRALVVVTRLFACLCNLLFRYSLLCQVCRLFLYQPEHVQKAVAPARRKALFESKLFDERRLERHHLVWRGTRKSLAQQRRKSLGKLAVTVRLELEFAIFIQVHDHPHLRHAPFHFVLINFVYVVHGG